MKWDPARYHDFQAQRSAPFEDLLRFIPARSGLRVVDLGCGTGELTARLADHLPRSDVLGLDRSPDMLAGAASRSRDGLRFEQGDLAGLEGSWDLIFSHAAVHWVDDHPALFAHLWSCLNPGGQLAVQMPSNHRAPAHRALAELAGTPPFRERLEGWRREAPVLEIPAYAELLFELGGQDLGVEERVYPHVLENARSVAEWIRGTTMLPYLERLLDLGEVFFEAYVERVESIWPQSPVFYPFRRILLSARKR